MWLLGLIAGMLIGGGMSGGGGAFAGAVIGAMVGAAFRTFALSETERRLKELEEKFSTVSATLASVNLQLHTLERAVSARPPARWEAAEPTGSATESVAPLSRRTNEPTGSEAVAAAARATDSSVAAVPDDALRFRGVDSDSTQPVDALPDEVNAATQSLPKLSVLPEPQAPQGHATSRQDQPDASNATSNPISVQPAATVELPPATEYPAGETPLTFMQRLLGGNIVAKAGVVILFFGVGFLLKFAYDHGVLPPWVRLLAVAATSVAMAVVGWRLLERRRLYALILMGGAMGFLYLDVFFALKTYAYIKPPTGFALFFVLGVATMLAAVKLDARALAVLGLTGAFLAPPLASTGAGSHVLLFSYYTLLNAMILGVSWFKAWRDLNLVGFLFTFVISSIWGASNFRSELFVSVEPFLLLFFAMYLAIPVLFALRQPPQLKGFVDATLVFGVPLAASFMQSHLVADMGDHALAWSAGGASLVYFMMGFSLVRREALATLGEAHLALGTIFATFAVFFAFDAYPTFALWTLEGAAVVWIGLRQRRLLARLFGLALQLFAAFYFLTHRGPVEQGNLLFDDFLFGCGLIAIASWMTAHFMHKYADALIDEEQAIGSALALWGLAWWIGGAFDWMDHHVPERDFGALALLFSSLSLSVAEVLGARWPLGVRDQTGLAQPWPALRRLPVLHAGFLFFVMLLLAQSGAPYHPLERLGTVAWPAAFAAYFWILHRQRRDAFGHALEFRYGAGWAALAVLTTWEAAWQLSEHNFAAALFCALIGFAAAYLRFHLRERDAPEAVRLSRWVLLWALAVWFAAVLGWTHEHVSHSQHAAAWLAVTAVSLILFETAGSLLGWADLRRTQILLPLAMAAALPFALARSGHVLTAGGAMAWATALAALAILLRRQERAGCAVAASGQHTLALWLAVAVVVSELIWRSVDAGLALMWARAVWGVVPALTVLLVAWLCRREGWPFGIHREAYLHSGTIPLLLTGLLWSFYANVAAPGTAVPSVHLPLLNPLDLTQLVVFAAVWKWHEAVSAQRALDEPLSWFRPAFALAAFVWVNGVTLRALHYYVGVDYRIDALLKSVPVQSSLSILWTACALALMLLARRYATRMLWMVGAALLSVVVLKLFTNDLGNSGTVARIVSFIGVGGLLLVIGYIAPVPPTQSSAEARVRA